jgi:predicted permease
VLVVAQVGLALVLLTGAGLMIRSFQALRRVDPGFTDPARVQTLRIAIPRSQAEDAEQAVRIHEQIRERLVAIPGVTSVGLSSSITMDRNDNNDPLLIQDFPTPEGQIPPIRRMKWVSPGFFETMGNRIVAGRGLEWADVHDKRNVVVITENLAREYWKEPQAAVGRLVKSDIPGGTAAWREVVGVVADAYDDGVSTKAPAIAYWPMVMTNFRGAGVYAPRNLAYAIRSDRVGTATFMSQVQQAVWAVNANLPLANVETLDDLLRRSMARTSFTLVMLGIAAAVALLLGAVGIYGVISYIVAQRTREIGVRMALGAQRSDVRGMVLRHGLTLAGIGLGAGLVASAALARLMSSLLFGVAPIDPGTYAAVSVIVGAIALLASWIPARRATRIDPIEALRWE